MEDTLAHALVDQYPTVTPMGITAVERTMRKSVNTRYEVAFYPVNIGQINQSMGNLNIRNNTKMRCCDSGE
jgi:hypothetical protein